MPPQQRLGRVLLNHHHLHAAAAAEPPNRQQKMPAKRAQLHKQKEEYGGIVLPLHRRLLEDALQALLLQQAEMSQLEEDYHRAIAYIEQHKAELQVLNLLAIPVQKNR